MLKKIFLVLSLLLLNYCTNNPDPETNIPNPEVSFGTGRIIDGYTNHMSFNNNDSIEVFLNADSLMENTKVPIFDVNGNIVSNFLADIFPQEIQENSPWENGYGYVATAKFKIKDLKSGLYFIDNKIPFIIKPSNQVDAIVLYPSNTINAYNKNEGYSLYTNPRAHKLSFHRQQNFPRFSLEFFKWVSNFDFGYLCDFDLDNYQSFTFSDLIIIPGHSEYWSKVARENFDQFINNGNDAMILSGNNMWWQIRYEEEGNVLVCYKDYDLDPVDDLSLKTINWHNPLLDFSIISSIGCDFSNGGYGLKYDDDGWDGYKIILPESPIFQGLNLNFGQILSIPTVEYDSAPVLSISDSGIPQVDSESFHKFNLLGFDKSYRGSNKFGTLVIMQKTEESGIIINTASTDWGNRGLMGKDSLIIKQITLNMISLLKTNNEVFLEN